MTIYAIKTGRVFTAVIVDTLRNQCAVPLSKREPGGAYHLYVSGTGTYSIRKASADGAGESFKTLAALLEEHPDAIRARDLDTNDARAKPTSDKCGCSTRYRRRVVRCHLNKGHESEKHEERTSENEVLVWRSRA